MFFWANPVPTFGDEAGDLGRKQTPCESVIGCPSSLPPSFSAYPISPFPKFAEIRPGFQATRRQWRPFCCLARTEIERELFPFFPPLLFQYPGSDVFPSPLERYFNISHFDFSSFFPILHFPPFCEKGGKRSELLLVRRRERAKELE